MVRSTLAFLISLSLSVAGVAQTRAPLAAYAPDASRGAEPHSTVKRLPQPAAPLAETRVRLSASAAGKSAETVVERHPDGQSRIERQVALDDQGNYVNHGTYRWLDARGNVICAGQYHRGQRAGRWLRTFAAGSVPMFRNALDPGFEPPFTSEATFRDDQLHGVWSFSDQRERRIFEWNFQNGSRQGVSTWWNPAGAVIRQMSFQDDQIHGDVLVRDGKTPLRHIRYLDGRELAPHVAWWNPGRRRSEGTFLKTRRVTRTTYDWFAGEIHTELISQQEADERHGVWTFWHLNGQRAMSGRYDHDLQVGTFQWWYESGQLRAEGEYRQGQQTGLWTYWYPTGMRQSEGTYVDGQKDGSWSSWHANGMKKSREEFLAGARTGRSRYWNAEGATVEGDAETLPELEPADVLQSQQPAEQQLGLSQRPILLPAATSPTAAAQQTHDANLPRGTDFIPPALR